MDRHGIRYVFEHKILPQWFFEHKQGFVGLLLHEKDFLYESISEILMLKLSFPKPEEEPLCYCSYLFFDEAFEKISYFCIEEGGTESQMPFVCAWTPDGTHQNYGKCTFTEHNDFLRCADIHMETKYGLTRNAEEDA